MSFSDDSMQFGDIVRSIDLIDAFLEGMVFEAYRNDLKTRSAVERQMQIVTEAAIRLGDEADTICPGPDWEAFGAWETF